ncbi:bacillithiol biosynthesis deacetylase BshB2 [Alicyclobacillus hesperidum subsp. aegles]|uniref:PIG-L family deacetylase n=1 Tax=Alicyclobacillus hesperidum TaxID=89784 RepID=UPI00222CF26C|nr:PIG-L family deacetylase [Alicyclobacillus hesperidum]GLF99998.1 bacillithiol biosynthesis deacetylase BshB2 [Alicyclobacillus hesperidum subsp. aegles]
MATVVAVFAHPDDETFICGGTLAKLAGTGHRVILVCATLGEMGRRLGIPPIATRESIGQVRERELRAACEALGIERLELLGLRDKTLEIQPQDEVADRVLQVFLHENPSAVITFHDPLGGHPDHCAIGRIATKAFSRYQTTTSGNGARLFYVSFGADTAEFRRFPQPVLATVQVDVSGYQVEKLRAFRAHRTQSQLDRALWGSERRGVERMGNREYFVHTMGPRLARPTSLLDE